MTYKWKPSRAQRREFAQKMANDSDFANDYLARKEERSEKRRQTSRFDYSSAGGMYVPTHQQYLTALKILGRGGTPEQEEASRQVTWGYTCNEKTHHDNIHIVNEFLRNE